MTLMDSENFQINNWLNGKLTPIACDKSQLKTDRSRERYQDIYTRRETAERTQRHVRIEELIHSSFFNPIGIIVEKAH